MLFSSGKKLFLLFLFSQICNCRNRQPRFRQENERIYPKKTPLIYNGTITSIKKFPWLAELLITVKGVEVTCGGVIVSSRVIVTTAHCIVDFKSRKTLKTTNIRVFIGSSYKNQGEEYKVCQVKKHPLFQHGRFYYFDIALILLTTKITFGDRARRAKIIRHDKWQSPKNTFTVAGYGLVTNNPSAEDYDEAEPLRIRETTMRFVVREECANSPSGIRKMPVADHMFCMVGEDTSDCYGDSGSGVMWDEYVVGLISIGRVKQCGSNVPSMYVNIHYFRRWLEECVDMLHLRKDECNPKN